MARITIQQLNGKTICYTSLTVFRVDVGKGSKGSYKTKYSFKGNLSQAVSWYNGINIGHGYKKRLTMQTPIANPKPVTLVRDAS